MDFQAAEADLEVVDFQESSSTNAELILFGILDELNVKFSKHEPVKTICQADAFVEPNVILFADGDYWHCNPKFYSKPKTEAQFKNIKRDFKETVSPK